MTDSAPASTPTRDDSTERLRAHAAAAPRQWQVAFRPQQKGAFAARVELVRGTLESVYERLPPPVPQADAPPDPWLELRENPRLLRSALADMEAMLSVILRLPRTSLANGDDEPRVVTVAANYLEAAGSVWSRENLRIYLDALQLREPLLLKELWNLPTALKFVLTEQMIAHSEEALNTPASEPAPAAFLSPRMKSLREVTQADWENLIEPFVAFDPILRQDPAQAYSAMDFESREFYRKRVAEIARCSERSEVEVARTALALAQEAHRTGPNGSRLHLRRSHIGYYLLDRGFPQLAARIGYRPRFIDRLRITLRENADDFFIGGVQILAVLLMALIVAPLVPDYPVLGGLSLAILLLLLPASQGAVDLVNNTVTSIFRADPLPKLDFSLHIPEDCTTLVAVPTLLMTEKQVRKLVDDLEVRYLANSDPNLHFALLTDLPDSVSRPRENDSDPLVDLAVHLIDNLNARYRSRGAGSFLLLHRHRIFNARQGVWMGWERKRGKLLDLNQLLEGAYDSFPVKAGNLDALARIRYVITLDSDTQLPRGAAHRMIGALAHPLNRAIVDPELRIVTEGYGILQPRVGVSVSSASRSRLAAIFSGQTGFDIYTRAISDPYQDLYGEGIFTGKGIYEVAALHAVLDRRFPRNSLLSHDLIEGAYARAGLTTDIEVIDDYPSHYSAYTRRKHRWVRGDWQITPWIFSRVPDESGHWVRNPISTISRWKIVDNLRRSLVEPFTFLLLLAGWFGLPGGPLYWTLATLVLLFIPTLVQFCFGYVRALAVPQRGAAEETLAGFAHSLGITLLNLIFLPHQTMLSIDAIARALIRRFVTGQRLLEWETAFEAEMNPRRNTPVDRYLALTPLIALVVAALVLLAAPGALLVAAPILLLWGCAGVITAWLNRPPRAADSKLNAGDEAFLHEHALRIWRFFSQFGGEEHNYLIPDHVEEDGLFEAARVSPTNLGLLFNARQAACELGYLTVPEFAFLNQQTFATIERLEKHRGHLYNWYDTRTLEALRPAVVSTVDNGNFAASLYTLHTGTEALLKQPLLSPRLFHGLANLWQLSQLQMSDAGLGPIPRIEAIPEEWLDWTLGVESLPLFASASDSGTSWWRNEFRQRIGAINTLARHYLPWLMPEFAPLRALPQLGLDRDAYSVPLDQAAAFAQELDAALSRNWATLSGESPNLVLGEQLRSLLPEAVDRLESLASSVRSIVDHASRVADGMDFRFLLNPARKLLSIGYMVDEHKVHEACYDLLASEARIAAFLAVAKGDIPQESWFKLGRAHVSAFNRTLLLSWTGTMFEYLMPSLWMRSYPDTLVSRSLEAHVAIQIAFAQQHRIPWGISECGYARKDREGHYQYQAFGIPQIALKWDAEAGPVISPYSSFLTLSVDSCAALRNLRQMSGAGWIGDYGFYEAADFSESLERPVLVREWMAHHQGMSLLAALNLLRDNIVQRWFHSNPHLQATELLLHEKPMPEAQLRAEHKRIHLPRAKRAS